MNTVDTHAHIFAADSELVSGARYRPAADATVEAFIANLDRNQIAYGVLIQPSFLGVDNRQMLHAMAAYPQRLKGVAVVGLDISENALDRLSSQGIVGARLNLFGQSLPELASPEWQQWLARLGSRNWQIELHCPPAYLRALLPALAAYPGPLVLDHFGRVDSEKGTEDPDYQAVLDLLDPARHWVKVSGHYRLGAGERGVDNAHKALQLLLDRGLQNRLVWGSDWPHTQYEQLVEYGTTVDFLHALVPDAKLRAAVLATNACELFGFAG